MTHRLKAVNQGVTTLAVQLGASDTTATVGDGSVLPAAPARVVIGSEVIEYGGKSGNDLTSLLRGREGTSGVVHDLGASVINAFTAGYYDELSGSVPVTLVIAAADTSKNPYRADYIVPTGNTKAQEVIQTALAALPAAGGHIVLLEGTYTFDNQVEVPDKKVIISGQGRSTKLTWISNPAAANRFFFFPATTLAADFTLKDLDIDGNNAAFSPWQNIGAIYDNTYESNHVTLSNVHIYNIGYGVIMTEYQTEVVLLIDNCRFFQVENDAIETFYEVDIVIRDSHFSLIGDRIIYPFGARRVLVDGCQFGGADVAYGWNSILQWVGPSTPIGECVFQNNYIYGKLDSLLHLGAEGGKAVVRGNTFHAPKTGTNQPAGVPIYCYDAGSLEVSNNTITFASDEPQSVHAIHVVSSSRLLISSNIIQFTPSCPIKIHMCNYGLVQGNHIFGGSIRTDEAFSGVEITGISTDGTTQIAVLGNKIHRGTGTNQLQYGVSLDQYTSLCYVAGNDLYQSGKTGDVANAGTNNTIANNRLSV